MKKLCKACKILMVFVMCCVTVLIVNNVFAANNFSEVAAHDKCTAGEWQNYNEAQHVKRCIYGCTQIMEYASHNNKLTWTGSTHTKTCNDCGGKYTRNHTYDKTTGKCTGCPYVCAHTYYAGVCTTCKYACVHSYGWQKDKDGHWKECAICQKRQGKIEGHNFNPVSSVCMGCGYICKHNYIWQKNDTKHYEECSICKKQINEGTHNGEVCICGYKSTTGHVHSYNVLEEQTEIAHKYKCKCGEIEENKPHSWNSLSGMCKICGYKCEHKASWLVEFKKINDNQCKKECKRCKKVDIVKHEYRNYSYKCSNCKELCGHADGFTVKKCTSHLNCTSSCPLCGFGSTAPHRYDQVTGECECGATKNCEWKYVKDNFKHYQKCEKCGITTPSSNHIYEEGTTVCIICSYNKEECVHKWSWIKDEGTHKYTCNICGEVNEKETGEGIHEYNLHGEICKLCGYKCKHSEHTIKFTDNKHWEECMNCGKELSTGNHTYNIIPRQDTHDKICKICEYTKNEQHDLEWKKENETKCRNICKVCDKTIAFEDHVYSANKIINITTHKEMCTNCKYLKEEAHAYEWQRIDDKQCKHACSVCGKIEKIDKHKYYGATCYNCKEDCTHSDGWKWERNSSTKEHWQRCLICGGTQSKAQCSYAEGKCICGDELHTCKWEYVVDGNNHYQNCSICGSNKSGGKHTYNWQTKDRMYCQLKCVCGELKDNPVRHQWENGACKNCGFSLPNYKGTIELWEDKNNNKTKDNDELIKNKTEMDIEAGKDLRIEYTPQENFSKIKYQITILGNSYKINDPIEQEVKNSLGKYKDLSIGLPGEESKIKLEIVGILLNGKETEKREYTFNLVQEEKDEEAEETIPEGEKEPEIEEILPEEVVCTHTEYTWEKSDTKHKKICKECQEVLEESEHSYKDGVCVCGDKDCQGNIELWVDNILIKNRSVMKMEAAKKLRVEYTPKENFSKISYKISVSGEGAETIDKVDRNVKDVLGNYEGISVGLPDREIGIILEIEGTLVNEKTTEKRVYYFVLEKKTAVEVPDESITLPEKPIDPIPGNGEEIPVPTPVPVPEPEIEYMAMENVTDWAVPGVMNAEENNIIPDKLYNVDSTENITREEFAAIAVKIYEAVLNPEIVLDGENYFEDTNDEDVLKARQLGIVSGRTETEFVPEAEVTRQEMATMMLNTIRALGMEEDIDLTKVERFNDHNEIYDWAIDSVYYMRATGIMKGVLDNKFEPLQNATREQAIVMASNCIEYLTGKN